MGLEGENGRLLQRALMLLMIKQDHLIHDLAHPRRDGARVFHALLFFRPILVRLRLQGFLGFVLGQGVLHAFAHGLGKGTNLTRLGKSIYGLHPRWRRTHIKTRLGPNFFLEKHIWNPELDDSIHHLLIFEPLFEANMPVEGIQTEKRWPAQELFCSCYL